VKDVRGVTTFAKQAPGRTAELTARHWEILVLIVQGLTSRQIGARLGISRRTVEVHRTNMMRRLGARSVDDLFRETVRRHRLVPGLDDQVIVTAESNGRP
jgi:DNA-binding NarL/FixJ family response regulator